MTVQLDSASELRAIYDAHFAAVWHHLRRMGVAKADRDDLAQEVFLTVHQKLATWDRSRPVRPWLIGIASRVTLHYWRTKRRRPGDRPAEENEPDPAASDADRNARMMLAALLQTLDPDRRAQFILHELEGFSIPEIAELTETPVNTVYSQVRRTRQELVALAQRWQQQEAS
ncbi:MAG: RNA polymerase sigma factor [Kofleriaceae bacterium]